MEYISSLLWKDNWIEQSIDSPKAPSCVCGMQDHRGIMDQYSLTEQPGLVFKNSVQSSASKIRLHISSAYNARLNLQHALFCSARKQNTWNRPKKITKTNAVNKKPLNLIESPVNLILLDMFSKIQTRITETNRASPSRKILSPSPSQQCLKLKSNICRPIQ